MSIEEVRHQTGLRLSISEIIAGVALLVTLLSGLNGWIVLPEQLNSLRANDTRQDARIGITEQQMHSQAETLARIDERTRRIEEFFQSHK